MLWWTGGPRSGRQRSDSNAVPLSARRASRRAGVGTGLTLLVVGERRWPPRCGSGAMRAPVGVSVAERRPNKRLKLAAPGLWEELRLCASALRAKYQLS